MIPEHCYWEEFGDSLNARFLQMDIHSFILESGFQIPAAIRKLYNPGIYCERGYQIIDLSDEFSLSVIDDSNLARTSELVGECAVTIGAFVSGALLFLTKENPDTVKIWDYGSDGTARIYAEYGSEDFFRVVMPVVQSEG